VGRVTSDSDPKAAGGRAPRMSIEWFSRLTEISGLGYPGDPKARSRRLKGSDAVPAVESYTAQDGASLAGTQSLRWPTTAGSPAQDHAYDDLRDRTTSQVLRNLHEALELPGEPTDYHFAIQRAATALWDRRRTEPDALDEVERLCWLDIRLIQAAPIAITNRYGTGSEFFGATTFKTLITLYEREGALREALEVAVVAGRFGQLVEKAQDLRVRLGVLEAEDA
jgi:hypothetical protein